MCVVVLVRLATTGNETVDDSMDTVARHVGHSYDLRSLHRGTGGGDINSTAGQCVLHHTIEYDLYVTNIKWLPIVRGL